jgi:hypothetical protein
MLADGAFLWAVEVGDPPKRIIVTEGWGFVFVEAANALWLFSVNGRLLKKVEIEWELKCAVTWKCEKECDFVAIADRGGTVRIFEAFFMNVDELIWEGKGRVVAMAYSLPVCVVIVVMENGDIIAIPKVMP